MTTVTTNVQARSAAAVRERARERNSRQLVKKTIFYLILLFGAVISLFPYWLALLTSLKSSKTLFVGPPWSLPVAPTLQNYVTV
ncbi:MAG: hypothetical protein JO031_10310, partial [Ktedonobacteraceae bacterium]|nr:hypothetical protein [Ktedonobacteraceae bacterium]